MAGKWELTVAGYGGRRECYEKLAHAPANHTSLYFLINPLAVHLYPYLKLISTALL